MKKLLALALAVSMFAGCTQRNSKGQCVGLADKEDKIPGQEYDVDLLNVFMAVLFSETVVVPVVVVGWMLECPVE